MSSWTQNYYHAVYATKGRTPWITANIESRVHAFLGGIAKDLDCVPIAINGMSEHVHPLVRFPSKLAIDAMLRHLKSRSSKWIHETFPDLRAFGWQDGYGGFTVSKSGVDRVEHYVRDQKIHHEKLCFEDEFESVLRKTGWVGTRQDLLRLLDE